MKDQTEHGASTEQLLHQNKPVEKVFNEESFGCAFKEMCFLWSSYAVLVEQRTEQGLLEEASLRGGSCGVEGVGVVESGG